MTRPGPVGVLIVVLVLTVSAVGSGPILLAGATTGFGPEPGSDSVLESSADTGPATGSAVAGTDSSGTTHTLESSPPAATVGTADPATVSPFTVSVEDFDKTTFEITVHENGSATWTFSYEQQLGQGDNDTSEESFETFAEEFEGSETELYTLFTEQAQAMVESGTELTGREMAATNFNRSARIDGPLNPVGVVEMSFRWDGFAATEDGEVIVGDVFQNLYLTADQSMVIAAGDGLTFQHVEPEGDYTYQYDSRSSDTELEEAESVRWRGEREFFDGRPRVVFDRTAASGGVLSSVPDAGPSLPVVTAGLAVLLAVGGAVWYRRRDGSGADGGSSETPAAAVSNSSRERTGTDAATPTGAADSEHPAPSATSAATAPAGSSSDAADSAAGSGSRTDPLSDEELLTDEDRVVKLIRENGGRMKQVNIVEETGWSKSKVSMLLSDMEDEGLISKLRVGRENIISLDGFEPEATKSPFDE
ncbi:helix-turn-helix transcriptional regulator [Halopiger aswanensis]|uniref:Putative membrane protein n=1 Tax=Halopiger aswanensis TaxID=148449 RepID=A0A3R7GVJ5_9EURY|nr:helix-turn-helix domain-containing protein [Halopiger aswanensis]RKD94989.1 putative membrane protein [Halopiger aswanensis]